VGTPSTYIEELYQRLIVHLVNDREIPCAKLLFPPIKILNDDFNRVGESSSFSIHGVLGVSDIDCEIFQSSGQSVWDASPNNDTYASRGGSTQITAIGLDKQIGGVYFV
jgi:hypothetical protein